MSDSMEAEGWGEYRRLVIDALARLDSSIVALGQKIDDYRHDGQVGVGVLRDETRNEMAKMEARIVKMEIEFGMQKVRTGLLGAAAGAVPMLIAAVLWYATRK